MLSQYIGLISKDRGSYFASKGFDVLFAFCEGGFILDVYDHDPTCPFFCEGDGNGITKSTGTTCNECYARCEWPRAFRHIVSAGDGELPIEGSCD
jgi:hypothetical protein